MNNSSLLEKLQNRDINWNTVSIFQKERSYYLVDKNLSIALDLNSFKNVKIEKRMVKVKLEFSPSLCQKTIGSCAKSKVEIEASLPCREITENFWKLFAIADHEQKKVILVQNRRPVQFFVDFSSSAFSQKSLLIQTIVINSFLSYTLS